MAVGLLAGAAKGLLGGAKGAAAKGAAAKGGGGKALAQNIMGRGGNDEGAKALPQAQKTTVIRAPRVDFSKIIQKLQGDKKKKEGSAIQDAFQSLKESSTNILKTLKDSVTFKKKNEKDKKQRRLNFLRGIREKAAEGGGAIFAFGKGVFKRVPFMSNILDYFKNILIGSVVMAIIQNIDLIVNFFKETWEKISEFFTLVNDYFIQPIWEAAKWIAGPAVGFIADIMGKKPDPNEVRTLESDLDFILNQIPGIKQHYNALKQKAGQQPEEFDGPYGFSRGGGYRAASAPSPVAGDKEFQAGVTALAKKYDLDEDDLYAVMSFETAGTFDPAQKNMAGSEATGLIQFTPETAKGLGTTTAELARMSRTEQLKYVDKFLANKGIQGGNLDDLYMAIIFPAAVGKPDDFVLFGRGARAGYGPGSRAYSQNRGLDLNNDGSVTKAEAASEARKHKGRAPRPPSEVAPSVTPTTPLVGGQAYGTGLRTGPSAYIGGSSDYHIDTKLKADLSMDETIDMFDQMARAYEAQGRVIEFSNAAVADERYRSSMTRQQKEDLLRRAFAAHAPRGGYRAFDYYIPKAGEDREGKSAEGAEIFVPTSPGGRLDYGTGGDYGNYVLIYDAQGRLIGKTGHGDSRFGRSSGSVRTPAQVQRTRPPADVEPIERTTTYGDQSSTIILLNNTEGTQVASAPVSSATQTQRPMQQNRGQLIAQYQSSLMLTSLNKVS